MKTAVLVSGGVDSAVALRQLAGSAGVEAVAFYLKVWLEDEAAFLGECPWEEDLHHARAVCEAAGVRLEVVPFQREYRERIVASTLAELKAGRTPSSDVQCNQHIKFGAFLDHVGSDFDRVASGHYAGVEESGGRYRLLRSPDPVKDQTYFLSRLDQAQLGRCLFPLAPYTKAEVRRLAKDFALPNAARPDSQGICFLGQIPFAEFIRHHLGERRGEIREAGSERVLGQHRGYWFHTIGQRRGLGLGNGPWFVVGKDVERNRIYVVHGRHLPVSSRSSFRVEDVHWIDRPPQRDELEVKLRHGAASYRCQLAENSGDGFEVRLEGDDPGIAAGQFAVFYDGAVCLGSGVIT